MRSVRSHTLGLATLGAPPANAPAAYVFVANLVSFGSQGATLRIDEASVDGVNVCEVGTYTLPPEE